MIIMRRRLVGDESVKINDHDALMVIYLRPIPTGRILANFGENCAVGMGRILAKTGKYRRILAKFAKIRIEHEFNVNLHAF